MQIRNTAKNESVFILNPKPGLFGSAEAQGVPAEAAGAGGQHPVAGCGRSASFHLDPDPEFCPNLDPDTGTGLCKM